MLEFVEFDRYQIILVWKRHWFRREIGKSKDKTPFITGIYLGASSSNEPLSRIL